METLAEYSTMLMLAQIDSSQSLAMSAPTVGAAISNHSESLPLLNKNHPAQVRPAARRAPRDHRGALAAPVDTRRIRPPPPPPVCSGLWLTVCGWCVVLKFRREL